MVAAARHYIGNLLVSGDAARPHRGDMLVRRGSPAASLTWQADQQSKSPSKIWASDRYRYPVDRDPAYLPRGLPTPSIGRRGAACVHSPPGAVASHAAGSHSMHTHCVPRGPESLYALRHSDDVIPRKRMPSCLEREAAGSNASAEPELGSSRLLASRRRQKCSDW